MIAHTSEVVWYVTGRFYATSTQLLDVGYFLHLQGLAQAPMQRLTFAAEPFTAHTIDNGGLMIGIDLRGRFSIYLQDGGATFDDPATFARGLCVGTFERVAIVPTVNAGTFLSNVFSARLVSSTPFELDGARYDLRELIGCGVTQWGTAVPESSLQPPDGYTAVVPFLGSAIRVG